MLQLHRSQALVRAASAKTRNLLLNEQQSERRVCHVSLSTEMHLTQHFSHSRYVKSLNEPIYFSNSDNSSLVVPDPPLLDIVCDVKVNKLI